MNRPIWKLVLIVGMIGFFPIVEATAQSPTAKRTCRLLFLNPPPNAPEKLFLYDGTTSQEVELPKMNFSKVYEISGGDGQVSLLPAPISKPEEFPQGAPLAKLSAAVTDFYLVASSDPTNKVVPIRIQMIDAGASKFRKGQMMWYNLTPHSIGGQLGSQKLAMAGQSRAVIDAPATKNEAFDVMISYRRDDDPQFYPISSTKWMHDPRARMVMFAYLEGSDPSPVIVGFKDYRDSERKTD